MTKRYTVFYWLLNSGPYEMWDASHIEQVRARNGHDAIQQLGEATGWCASMYCALPEKAREGADCTWFATTQVIGFALS